MVITQHDLSVDYVESLYADYQRDPASVSADWRSYFASMPSNGHQAIPLTEMKPKPGGNGHSPSNGTTRSAQGNGRHPGGNGNGSGAHAVTEPSASAGQASRVAAAPSEPQTLTRGGLSTSDFAHLQHRVDQLVRNFRVRGHNVARLDPLGAERPELFELDPACCGITDDDLTRSISTESVPGQDVQTVREIIDLMRSTYCRSIGVQFMHIDSLVVRQWLIERMEGTQNRLVLDRIEQKRILRKLTEAVTFEEFIQKKYIGAKSFSLEGAETLIPLLDLAIEKAGHQGVREIVMGMAHRGRLNVLANIMRKPVERIFREFEDQPKGPGSGDVKYHMGYSTDYEFGDGKKLHISLCFNPSHLEFINPVAMGRMRAKMDRCGDFEREHGLVLMIHGDAAFIGEGITQETLNLSELPAYKVGGALHIVINNQIGFTTTPDQSRSSAYCTDVAKMLQAPIFHVNGEDPEAVAHVVRLAMDFRARFKRDVFIDMYCYRRRGHNEGDEPMFTQPKMYQAIEKRKWVGETYLENLVALGGVTRAEGEKLRSGFNDALELALKTARTEPPVVKKDPPRGVWAGYCGGYDADVPEAATGLPAERLSQLLTKLTQVPEGFHVNPKVDRILKTRLEMARGKRPLDWAAGEALAFASLATDGHRVRMTGQDVERGTFSHRHAMLHDIEDGGTYMPLKHLSPDQAPVDLCNSALSEAGVLGFEYGYSLDCPEGLVAWEAQFGDFHNCAQTIIDQFITSAEDKWDRLSGITLLLPHGYEGQGPEHSSARIERWLTMGAQENIQVCIPSTPAQMYHLLRRQVLRKWHKPLIIMTPKSLLRHPDVVSPMEDLVSGRFQRVIPDARFGVPASKKEKSRKVERVLMCSGKIYYELTKRREELKRDDVAIIRMEKLYPLPHAELKEALSVYPDNTPVYWVQEEPRNMGAWIYLRANLGFILFSRLPFMGFHRPESASPATGSPSRHRAEQEQIIQAAFADNVGM